MPCSILDWALGLQFLKAYFKGYFGDIWGNLNVNRVLDNESIEIPGVVMFLFPGNTFCP